jgi:hypothetical protein
VPENAAPASPAPEYLAKGFAIDDERLMAGRSLGADYFDAG